MMRSTTVLLTLALAAGALASVGCRSTDPPASRADTVTAAAYPQVVAQDRLEGRLRHDRATVQRSESGVINVTVPVRVTTQRDVRAQYRFLFFDQTGRPLRPEMDWQYLQLPARTQVFLEGASLQPEAVDWRLEVREARGAYGPSRP
jgi:uncharacterized protein YcfL